MAAAAHAAAMDALRNEHAEAVAQLRSEHAAAQQSARDAVKRIEGDVNREMAEKCDRNWNELQEKHQEAVEALRSEVSQSVSQPVSQSTFVSRVCFICNCCN